MILRALWLWEGMEIDTLLETFDKYGDGKIDYEEFTDWLYSEPSEEMLSEVCSNAEIEELEKYVEENKKLEAQKEQKALQKEAEEAKARAQKAEEEAKAHAEEANAKQMHHLARALCHSGCLTSFQTSRGPCSAIRRLWLQTLDGHPVSLAYRRSDTVKHVKHRISLIIGVPVELQSLKFQGNPLENGHCIREYNLPEFVQVWLSSSL